MEGPPKGSKISNTTSIVSSAVAPWIDLPDVVTDLILERLNLRDYLRFSAVCRKWRSIQSNHRLCHFPFAPPMAQSLPWLLPYFPSNKNLVSYVSLSDSTLNRVPLPCTSDAVYSSHGWLLVFADVLDRFSKVSAYLFNPITHSRVQLPSLPPFVCPSACVLSAPPADPDCLALIICQADTEMNPISVCRVHDRGDWVRFPISRDLDNPFGYGDNISAIFCGGKFYCFCSGRFVVIDPLFPCLSMKILEMDCPSEHLKRALSHYLVASNGEVLMVLGVGTGMSYDRIQDFRVFRADFSRMTWVMVEELGDRVFFVDNEFAF